MKSFFRLALLTLPLLAAAPAAAQEPGVVSARAEQAIPGPDAERRPFETLIRARGQLALTDAQVTRLTGIGRDLQTRNAPLRARLWEERERLVARRRDEIARELEGKSPEERRAILQRLRREPGPAREVPPSMRPFVQEMRRNIRTAMNEAQKVLTPAQKTRVRQLLREQRRPRDERPLGRRRIGAGRFGGRP